MIYNKELKFRPAAVPLITVDPYFSIWSMHDNLNDGVTSHWTGRRNPMTAGVVIDDKFYVLMGELEPDSDRRVIIQLYRKYRSKLHQQERYIILKTI